MRDRIIALIFCIFVLVFGVGTFRRVCDANILKKSLKAEDMRETISMIEGAIDDNFAYKNKWINFNGMFQKAIGKTGDIEKDWFLLDNGQMIYHINRVSDDLNAKRVAAITSLSDYCHEKGAELMYVQLPYKVLSDEDYPPGIPDNGNRNSDDYIKGLRANGVKVLDIREVIAKEGMDYNDLFFKTDQHWTPRTALWAAGVIVDELGKVKAGSEWIYEPETYDIENFDIKTYEDLFLGSIGKKIGNKYSGVDDFEVITPKYETNYIFDAQSESGKIHREGSFKKTMIVKKHLKKDYFNINTYVTYLGGDYKFNTSVNTEAKNKKSILLLRDSFSCTLQPFLSLGIENITAVDLRYYTEKDVYDIIDENDFDCVIIAYNPSVTTNPLFEFGAPGN